MPGRPPLTAGLLVEDGHARQTAVDTTDDLTALLDRCQRAAVLGVHGRRAEDKGSDNEPGYELLQQNFLLWDVVVRLALPAGRVGAGYQLSAA